MKTKRRPGRGDKPWHVPGTGTAHAKAQQRVQHPTFTLGKQSWWGLSGEEGRGLT